MKKSIFVCVVMAMLFVGCMEEVREQFVYYPNGNLHFVSSHISGYYSENVGELHGVYKEWYESGKLKKSHVFKYGQIHGKAKAYHPNGKLKAIGNYKDGKMDGKWMFYKENGQVLSVHNYVNGQEVGK
jgi:antitoxin component YwqK of YwqJK toxin-antitoxin module